MDRLKVGDYVKYKHERSLNEYYMRIVEFYPEGEKYELRAVVITYGMIKEDRGLSAIGHEFKMKKSLVEELEILPHSVQQDLIEYERVYLAHINFNSFYNSEYENQRS